MGNKNVLIYLQDIGGINFLLPVFKKLKDQPWFKLSTKVAHHASLSFLKEKEVRDFRSLKEKDVISIEDWKAFLRLNNINFVLATLSSKEKDKSNSYLLSASNELGINSLGFLDHWKGTERLVNYEGKYNFHPSYLGVIDEYSLKVVKELSLGIKKVFISGHPALEQIQSKNFFSNEDKDKNILLVSQPKALKGSFSSLFLIKNKEGKTFLNEIMELAEELNILDRLNYRPHPKEEIEGNIPKRIKIESNNKDYIMNKYDYFLGFDSILLVESHAAGKVSISINFNNIGKFFKDVIPYDYSYKVSSLTELKKLLKNNDLCPPPKVDYSSSTKNCLEIIQETLSKGET